MGERSAASLPRGLVAAGAAARPRALTPGERAWLAVVPCTLLVAILAALLGPPLGDALLAPRGEQFWPSVQTIQAIRPEPAEHAKYLIALLGPLLLCGAIVAGPHATRLPARWTGTLVSAAQWLTVLALVGFLAAQRLHTYGTIYGGPLRRVYFTWATIAVALLVAGLLVVAPRSPAVMRRAVAWMGETTRVRALCAAAALACTLAWLLTAVFLDSSIGRSAFAINVTLPFSLDEAYAVLNGRTPLVDFHAQYGQLWPYLAALSMSLFGAGVTTYTITMAAATGVVMLAVYATLRRIVRSSLAALALYLPFMATSFFITLGPAADRYGPGNLFTIFPVRYGGPYLLAWLTARHIDRAQPRALALLFCVAGLVALNNPEFGIAAVGGTIVALLWARAPVRRADAMRLATGALTGLLAALALLSLLTLARTGSLPRLGLLLEFARIDGVEGWTLVPLPPLGFHLAVFATFVAALAVATVRAVTRADDVLLTGMLAWAGAFGLGAGSYFVGRSHPEVLIDLFSSWSLAVLLLLVVVVRAIAAQPRRRPTVAQVAVLFAAGLCVCSLAQLPTPWSQVERLQDRGVQRATRYVRWPAADRFVAAQTRPGERVLILLPVSHRVAHEHGLTNVSPWVSAESMPLVRQLDDAVAALRAAGGHKVFLWSGDTWPEAIEALRSRGFVPRRVLSGLGLMEWVDS